MKLTDKILAFATVSGLICSCGEEEFVPAYTVGEADNVIVLSAGVQKVVAGMQTRAEGTFVAFSAQTQLRLRIDGTWTGHGDSQNLVSQMTTAKTASSATVTTDGDANDTHLLEFGAAEKLFWDDYGTADPNNTAGRTNGLTIYGAAVEGKSTLPSTPTDLAATDLNWTELPWNVGTVSSSKISQAGGWADFDLITSNNIRPTSDDGDGTYTFANATASPIANNLMKFTHAMTKVTVNLTAADGFPGFTTSADAAKFIAAPAVTLLGFNYTGSVNVVTKVAPIPTASSTTNIEAWRDKGATWTAGGQHTSQFTALVFPGNSFGDATDIIKIEADGNVYYVNATQVNVVNPETNNKFEQGKNYVFNITVKKTKIEVSATIKDWVDVNAAEDLPVININQSYGTTSGTGISTFNHSYDFFRSLTVATGYDEGDATTGIDYAARYSYTSGSGSWDKVIYWPDHKTHYFFRGVSPFMGTEATGTATSTSEAVTTVNGNDVVAVENAEYTADTYPSDLAIALPRTTGTKCQHNKDEQTDGICATTGTVTMNFEYAMSKVQVSLRSTGTVAAGNIVDLSNVQVEIIGGYAKGRIKLSDGLHDAYADADKGNYTLHNLTTPVSDYSVSTLDAIVPQVLGNDVKIRITVKDVDNNILDVYESQLNLIKDSSSNLIKEWKPGTFYHYQLDVKKTDIKVQATLSDWSPVNAEENVWF